MVDDELGEGELRKQGKRKAEQGGHHKQKPRGGKLVRAELRVTVVLNLLGCLGKLIRTPEGGDGCENKKNERSYGHRKNVEDKFREPQWQSGERNDSQAVKMSAFLMHTATAEEQKQVA